MYLMSKQNIRFWLGYHVIFNQGLRRPFFTAKAILLGLGSFGIVIAMGYLSVMAAGWRVGLLILYLAIPLVVSFVVLCMALPTLIAKWLIILMAKVKIRLRKSPLVVIGVTGSYGKTSTKQLLECVLKTKFRVFATGQSHNTLFSVAVDIVRFLSNEHTHAIIEYGAYKRGEIKQMTKLVDSQIAILTGITKQHYGLFGSYENLKKAKFELLESLQPDGLAFINCEDKNTGEIQSMSNQYHIRWRCFETRKWKTGDFKTDKGYLSFWLQAAEKKLNIKTKLIGEIYIENIKSVLAVAEYMEIPAGMIAEALHSFEPTDYFISQSTGLNQSTLLDDGGTTNPQGFKSAIRVAETMQYAKKILVTSGIVDLGVESAREHAELGEMAGKVFNMVFYTGAEGFEPFWKGWNKISDGKPIFQIWENSDLGSFQKEIDKNALVLIEGRLPIRVLKLLKPI